ncbi:hypothetical protein Neosp_007977 [[Neocosmospora] mangrovei]
MFIPESYEEDTVTSIQSMNLADVSKRDPYAFGSGRRACPGYHVAERSSAVAIMRILWAFEINPAEDAELPLDPSKFEGRVMPGSPDERLPVRLRVLDGRREVINDYFKTWLLIAAAIEESGEKVNEDIMIEKEASEFKE